MRDLDDPLIYPDTDPSGMRERLKGLARQGQRAWKAGLTFQLPADYANARQVVIAGMGGSAVGGDLIQGLVKEEPAASLLTVWRDYGTPPGVGPQTLLMVVSYSGNTTEAISAFEGGLEKGCKVLAITSGGRLGELAQHKGVPCLQINYVGEPRTALGYTFLAPLGVLCALGFITRRDRWVEQALSRLECLAYAYGPDTLQNCNVAKSLAYRLRNSMVVVYGAGVMSPVARRWKTQLNETAKSWAFAEEVPEVGHNGIMGYHYPPLVTQGAALVFLKCRHLSRQHRQGYEAIMEVAKKSNVDHLVIEAVEGDLITQVLTTAYLGDWLSYYLALLHNTDPSSVPAIDDLKQRLASGNGSIVTRGS